MAALQPLTKEQFEAGKRVALPSNIQRILAPFGAMAGGRIEQAIPAALQSALTGMGLGFDASVNFLTKQGLTKEEATALLTVVPLPAGKVKPVVETVGRGFAKGVTTTGRLAERGVGKVVTAGVRPVQAAGEAAREPWQMTYEQHFLAGRERVAAGSRAQATARDIEESWRRQEPFFRQEHRKAVENALSEGKPVPAEVLRDYPDLLKAPITKPARPIAKPVVKPPIGKTAEVVAPERAAVAAGARPVQAAGEATAETGIFTLTGRKLEPPKLTLVKSGISAKNNIKRVDAWLLEQAKTEAQSRGDAWNLEQFNGIVPAKITPAERNGLNLYMFGQEEIPLAGFRPAAAPAPRAEVPVAGARVVPEAYVTGTTPTGEVIEGTVLSVNHKTGAVLVKTKTGAVKTWEMRLRVAAAKPAAAKPTIPGELAAEGVVAPPVEAPTPAAPKPDLDAVLGAMEAEAAEKIRGQIIAKGKAAYISEGLKAAEVEAKTIGLPLNKAFQRRQLGLEYDKLAVGKPGRAERPVEAPLRPAEAPGAAAPPVEPPVTTGAVPPAEPIVPRPRTLLDLNREAKGMRAMTPEQRAAVMDVAEPITGDTIYQARPFNEHAEALLGPDTGFMKALRGVPGVKQAFGVWNPAQMARDNPMAMIGLRQSIFQEIEKARVRFAVLRWWHDADTAFGFKRTGTTYGLKPTSGVWKATRVKPVTPDAARGKMFGTINDIIEHPERYSLNDEQLKVLALADDTLTRSVRDAQRVGVDVVELAEAYWPRIVTRGPKGTQGFAGIKRRVTSSKGYTRQRVFSDVDDLVATGHEVETDPRRVFAARLEAGIDTIAHQNSRKQIAALPGVEKPLERMERRFPQVLATAKEARLRRDVAKVAVRRAGEKATPAEVMALRQAEADYITSMREVFAKKIEAGTPGYYEMRLPNGRIAPQELVEQVGKFIDLPELGQARGGAAELTREVSQLLRTTLTNVDLAAGFIQGQSLFYRNNVVWWKAQGHAIVSLIDDPTAYVAKNFAIIDEGVRVGAIVAPTEFLFAKQGLASIPLRIPYVGPGLQSFNRAFEWFITAGQTELYKAARSGVLKNAGMDDLVSMGSAIRKEVGTESYAILGVRPGQRTAEALSLFAARFFRANVGLIGQAFTGGPGGVEARRALGSLIAGGTAITIGVNWAQNKKLPNMTDPYMPDWMQFRIGKTYFNAFGPMYGYFRTIARISVAMQENDPVRAVKEAKQFLASKESLPFRAVDIAGQLTFYGQANVFGNVIEKTPLGIAKGIATEFAMPISAQEIPSGIAEGRPEAVLEFVGLQGRFLGVSAATNRTFEKAFPQLRRWDIRLGYVGKQFDMTPEEKGGEVELTREQRDALQQLTADVVIGGLPSLFALPFFQQASEEEKKEMVKARITKLRAEARATFGRSLLQGGVQPQRQAPRPAAPGGAPSPVAPGGVPRPTGGTYLDFIQRQLQEATR